MKKEVMICMSGVMASNADEAADVFCPGEYYFRKGKHFIRYEEKIADQSGVGGQLGENITIEIDNEEKLTVLEAFNSVEIVTGSDKFDYEIKNGKLVIYMLTENKFVDGDLRLTVEQFTSSNQIAKYKGTVTIASNKEGTWK